MIRSPLVRIAGLYDDEAVCPFTDGSVSDVFGGENQLF